jgi:hydrogenase nickel incorporation protein HypA/HybF
VHELAVCQALMDQVVLVAQREQARRVTGVTLQIGPLAGVEPQLLLDAWPIASAGGVAQGAELLIESMPLRVRCLECGCDTDAAPNRLLCGECGSFRTRPISGEELLLKSLELERDGKVA